MNGISVKDIYLHVFQSSLYEIGRLWQENKITVAQEHYCQYAQPKAHVPALSIHIYESKNR